MTEAGATQSADPAPASALSSPGPSVTEPAPSVTEPKASTAIPMLAPRQPMAPVIIDEPGLAALSAAVAAGHGPVALDSERASGYRYGQRAYLVQLRRAGVGNAMIDPVPLPDLSSLQAAIGNAEWVLHAATQDLPCLAELGLRPARLFDTELAGRLAGFPRVALGTLVEELLGFRLEKGHSAADWSTRPLPQPWLVYAVLDVELLLELRDALHAELEFQGKLSWALEEFAAIVAAPPSGPREDPWRRTSGLHRIRDRRALLRLRELWLARDAMARERDTSPGRLLGDAALVEAAIVDPTSPDALAALPGWGGRGARRMLVRMLQVLREQNGRTDLPPLTVTGDGPPAPRVWAERFPEAAARLTASRTMLTSMAADLRLPVENLLSPDSVRRVCWTPPEPLTPASVDEALAALGARSWQRELAAAPLSEAMLQAPVTAVVVAAAIDPAALVTNSVSAPTQDETTK